MSIEPGPAYAGAADEGATIGRPRRRRTALGHRGRVSLARYLFLAALIAAWEIYGRFYADPAFVRPPSAVAAALIDILADPQVRAAIWLTLFEVVAAYALSVGVGLAIGIAVGWNAASRRSTLPLVILIYAIPQVVLLPLVILVFGLGPAGKIFFGFSHGIFPVIVNVVAGMRNVNQLYLRGARSMGASRADIVRHVIFPHMVPSFFAGLRLAMTVTLLGVILAELYVSTAGIGFFTRIFAETFDPAPLFALIAVLTAIAVALNETVRIAERRFTRWRR